MPIPPRKDRWVKKSAQPPMGLQHYELEGFHGLATPSQMHPLHDFQDLENDNSPERLEAERAFDESYKEFRDIRSSVPKEFGDDAESMWSDTPAARSKIEGITRAAEQNPDLRGLMSDSYTTRESHDVARASQMMDNYVHKTLHHTKCPRCIAHIVGDSIDALSEFGIYDDASRNYSGFFMNDSTPVDPELHEDKYGPQEAWRRFEIDRLSNAAQGLRTFNGNIKQLIEIARENRGRTCPLHSRM